MNVVEILAIPIIIMQVTQVALNWFIGRRIDRALARLDAVEIELQRIRRT